MKMMEVIGICILLIVIPQMVGPTKELPFKFLKKIFIKLFHCTAIISYKKLCEVDGDFYIKLT